MKILKKTLPALLALTMITHAQAGSIESDTNQENVCVEEIIDIIDAEKSGTFEKPKAGKVQQIIAYLKKNKLQVAGTLGVTTLVVATAIALLPRTKLIITEKDLPESIEEKLAANEETVEKKISGMSDSKDKIAFLKGAKEEIKKARSKAVDHLKEDSPEWNAKVKKFNKSINRLTDKIEKLEELNTQS